MPDKPRLTREQIARRAALELPDGAYVNLGWGIPNLIADYLPSGIKVFFHSENGILGMGRRAKSGESRRAGAVEIRRRRQRAGRRAAGQSA